MNVFDICLKSYHFYLNIDMLVRKIKRENSFFHCFFFQLTFITISISFLDSKRTDSMVMTYNFFFFKGSSYLRAGNRTI